MGTFIVKADRERDLFAEWSTIVEAPTFIGTRAEILTHLGRLLGGPPADPPEVLVRRAEEAGTSAVRDPLAPEYTGPLDGAWDEPGQVVEQRGWLPRARMAEFLDVYLVDAEKAYGLLEPFDDDPEVVTDTPG
jgi:hypothetical protein